MQAQVEHDASLSGTNIRAWWDVRSGLAPLSLWVAPSIVAFLAAAVVGELRFSVALQAMVGSLLCIAVAALLSLIGRKAVMVAFALNAAVMIALYFYSSAFGQLPNTDAFSVVFQSNYQEASEFSGTFAVACWTVAILLAIGAFLNGWYLNRALAGGTGGFRRSTWVATIVLAVICLIPASRQWMLERNPYSLAAISYVDYREMMIQQQEYAASMLPENEPEAHATLAAEDELHICVIGESATRRHMSLYGYALPTTPLLSERKDLTVFTDVISRWTHTAKAIPSMFLRYESGTVSDPRKQQCIASLPRLLMKAGYRTWWISNQQVSGIYDNVPAVIGKLCDSFVFNISARNFDGELLPAIRNAIASSEARKKVIFVHLIGSHMQYFKRYPSEFSRFVPPASATGAGSKRERDICHYDNSILYSDWVVNEIVALAEKSGVPATVTYLSDHGDDVYDVAAVAGHTVHQGTAPMFEIPFLIWMSNAYRAANPALAEAIGGFTKRPGMVDSFLDTYLDLLGIESSVKRTQRSWLNAEFSAAPRLVTSGDYDLDIRNRSPAGVMPASTEPAVAPPSAISGEQGIWVHRVDSLEKLKEVKVRVAGIEIDVVFDQAKASFDVGQPSAPSIGLDLRTMLRELSSSSHQIWLDVNDLDIETSSPAAQAVHAALVEVRVAPERVFIESQSIPSLMPFKRLGLPVIFSSPYRFFRELNGRKRKQWSKPEADRVDRIHQDLVHFGVSRVSGPVEVLPFMLAEFSEVSEFFPWDRSWDLSSAGDLKKTNKVLHSNARVRCVLIRCRSKFDR